MNTRLLSRSFGARAAIVLASLALAACRPKPAEIRVTPAKLTFYGPGHSQSLKSDVYDRKGVAMPGLAGQWASDKPAIAGVDTNGLVRSLSPGRTAVTVTFQKFSASAAVDVVDVASLAVSPNRTTLVGPAGTRMPLAAEIKDSKGNPAPLKPKWLSGDPKVATVDADGVVTAAGEGRTTIIASLGNDVSSACDVRVLHREIAVFEVTPLTLILKVGETQRVVTTIKDAAGVTLEDVALSWTTSDPKTATVSYGAVTGVSRGTARISVATSAKTISADVVVN
jgi:hypothetical protein